MSSGDSGLSIGEVSAEVGMSVHALRYYEREDLLIGPVGRTSSGRRCYRTVDVEWLRICGRLRESGMPLDDLRRLAALVREGPGNEAGRLALLEAQRERVERQIESLEQAREVIARKADFYRERIAEGNAVGVWDPTYRADES